MANPDRAKGLSPVGTLSGASWQGLIRRAVMADTSADSTNDHGDIYVGTPIKLNASGLALPWESADTDCAGVCVGVGVVSDNASQQGGPFNPASLEKRYADSRTSDTISYLIFYAPAEDTVFEIQTSSTALVLEVTDYVDIAEVADTSTGSRTTGLSSLEAIVPGDSDFKIVAIPEYPDNDSTLANARLHGVFANTEFGAAR